MGLTAKEWLLLAEDEQEKRSEELSSHECFLLRTLYSHVHLSEEQKRKMTEDEKASFIGPSKREISLEEEKILKMTISEQINHIFLGKV